MELQKGKVYVQPLAQKNNEAKLRREQQEQEFNDKIRELERSRLERLKKELMAIDEEPVRRIYKKR